MIRAALSTDTNWSEQLSGHAIVNTESGQKGQIKDESPFARLVLLWNDSKATDVDVGCHCHMAGVVCLAVGWCA